MNTHIRRFRVPRMRKFSFTKVFSNYITKLMFQLGALKLYRTKRLRSDFQQGPPSYDK